MTQRVNFAQQSPKLFKSFLAFTNELFDSAIEVNLIDLVSIRISQMNACEFCLDLHVKQAVIRGESELRLRHVSKWRESDLFTPRERAALTWSELLTELPEEGISDEAYAHVREHLSEQEISDLSFLIVSVNGWDRINIGFKTASGRLTRNFD
ncbi:carboxymuconolactone decarboxylase family protein [Paenibacillus glycinis]|uniref:Carboxymuconolactone decarboxylase family protein n=1 Tax=Paenibacillus glycinis TaxID=2697035 RepID=A0ABW9XK15_9BACL|nr:carboxymuconolactone decarboxylase family protein [Paenibacillus glycinis]NBD22969.1 carboxymuconolactone decarboxylase family protein [Paenibacillus glycinis]